jgi:hypothetical protein
VGIEEIKHGHHCINGGLTQHQGVDIIKLITHGLLFSKYNYFGYKLKNMSTCILSPYGTYNTVDACNSSEICGMRWRCARHAVNGVYEKDPVTGQDVLPGNPILAHDGTFDTPEEVKCYECVVDMGNETAECKATDGVQGTSSDATCGGTCDYGYDCEEGSLVWKPGGRYGPELTSCDYVCGTQGEKLLVQPGETYPETSSWDDLQCYSCDPNVSTPLPVDAGSVGYIDASGVCTYTCENGEKVFDTSGLTTEELKCHQCTGGTTSEPVDGVDGYLDAGEGCLYACDEGGNKVYVESGGVSNYNSFGCYECTGGHDYTPVAGAGKGYASGGFDNDGEKCWYWCNDESSPEVIVRDVRDAMEDPSLVSKPTLDEVGCWTCDGDPGPGSGCAQVTQGVGQFSSAETCDTDSGAQCGWGYGCENDSCAITSSATRGRSEEECKMDSVEKCGWGYGCFNKYACVDGLSCVPVPEEECTVDGGADGKLVCYDSQTACVDSSACVGGVLATCESPLGGVWNIHRSFWGTNMLTEEQTGPNVITFASQDVDANGYTWYTSDVTFTDGSPIIEIGIRDVSTGTDRTIDMKFRGNYLAAGNQQTYWSKTSGNVGTFANPAAVVIAENLPLDECFVFDSVDLSKVCDGDSCVSGIATVILQREELCGDAVWAGKFPADANGVLSPNECPAFMCDSDPLVSKGPWSQYRGIVDGQRVHLNPHDINFVADGIDDDGYEWWVSTETTSDGIPFTEVGVKSEIQGAERVVYAKMKGLGVWISEGKPSVDADFTTLWSDSSVGADDGSYDDPAAYEIARVGESDCYSPDEFVIPFALDNQIWSTISHGAMAFNNTL